jgi:hypothetical protein
MTELDRLTAAFDAMNPWGRELLREFAEGCAIDFPAHEDEPAHPPAGVQPQKVPRDRA